MLFSFNVPTVCCQSQSVAVLTDGDSAAGLPITALTSSLVVRLQSVPVVDPPLGEGLAACDAWLAGLDPDEELPQAATETVAATNVAAVRSRLTCRMLPSNPTDEGDVENVCLPVTEE